MSKISGLAKEVLAQKKWILIPFVVLLVAFALMIVLGGGSTILPAIYIAF
jgi:hypothetical protein